MLAGWSSNKAISLEGIKKLPGGVARNRLVSNTHFRHHTSFILRNPATSTAAWQKKMTRR
jgi:hypothetical protein